jgi:hypothetical protein
MQTFDQALADRQVGKALIETCQGCTGAGQWLEQ